MLATYGNYDFRGPLSLDDARAYLKAGFVSAIGHHSTVELIEQLLKVEVPAQRKK
jgi:hypothetical protein